MNDDNKYDALKEIFQKKLENHQVPVDSSDWEAINQRLHGQSSSKKKLIAVWSAVAASLAILLTLAYLQNDREPNQLPHIYEKNAMSNTNDTIETHLAKADHRLKWSQPVIAKARHDESSRSIIHDAVTPGQHDSTAISQKEPEKEPEKELEKQSEKEPEKQSTEKQTVNPQNNSLFTVDYPSHTKKGKKELLLAASFGTSQSIGINTNRQYMQNAAAAPGEFGNLFSRDKTFVLNNELIPGNISGEYLPPLSFGLSVRKNLNTHWGIETGLVYTYLSSTYRWNYGTAFDATQQLHYLGVPLNGVFYLWNNNPRWNVYLSAGTMLEKGLWMKTICNQHSQDHTATTTQKNAIAGWQWSLNSSLGLSYRFTNKMELYVEPRFSYYFDNNQPASIRTDWPVSIGIGGGLRYSF